MSQPLYNQYYDPNAYGAQLTNMGYPTPYGQGGYPPAQQQPPHSVQYYPTTQPQGFIPAQHYQQPPAVQYGTMPPYGTPVYAPVPGRETRYNQPAVDPYHTYYQQAQQDQIYYETAADPLIAHQQPEAQLPAPETMPLRAIPKPKNIEVKTYLRKSIAFFVISLVTIVLWPVVPFTFTAFMCSLRAHFLYNKRSYTDAEHRGADAKCCLITSLTMTIAWCLILMGAALVVLLFVYVFVNMFNT